MRIPITDGSPSNQLEALSLNDEPRRQANHPTSPTPGPSSTSTVRESDNTPNPFGRQSPTNVNPVLRPPAIPSWPVINRQDDQRLVFHFGSNNNPDASSSRTNEQAQPFIFRALHNVTPLPSPFSSREPSPQPFSSSEESMPIFSPPQTPTPSRTPSTGNSLGLLHPLNASSPTPASRARSASATSSYFSTPKTAVTPARADSVDASPGLQPLTPVTPYDAKDEIAPAHGLFTTAFQNALKNGSKIASDAVLTIGRMITGGRPEPDTDLIKYLAEAKRLQNFQGTDTRTIAVMGDSGEGKSSLINSLVHVPGVAQTGDIGSACTSIVTEYRQKKPEHVAPITIEVEYLSTTGIQELVRELLWSYRQLFLPGVESNDTPPEEYARCMRESEYAWSALHAAFKHKRQFTQTYAQDISEGALEEITNQLLEWVDEIEWPSGATDGFWTSTADTAEQCVEQTKVFMQDRFWPFTKIIRVYLNSQVLKTGIVLADLPGLQDTNLARVRATQDYLIKCDNIFIVAKISRAITDQSIKSSLYHVFSRHVPTEWEDSGARRFKVAVVCTRSEDINPLTARSEFCGPNKRVPQEIMAQLDQEIDAAKATGDRKRKKVAKKRQELLLVQARNAHVREGLQAAYASEMDGRTLNVFCVSNKWYEKYCPKGNTEFVQASGIPELRQFCHTISADAQLSEAKNFLKARMSAFLNSLDIWASSSLASREKVVLHDSIFTELDSLQAEIPGLVNNFRSEYTQCFEEQTIRFFTHREEKWKQAASEAGREWATWHWTQYDAWCRNNGIHQTNKRGYQNWNSKIIWKMRMELEEGWEIVEEEVSPSFSALLDAVVGRLKGIKDTLQESGPSEYVTSLSDGLDSQVQNLEYNMHRHERDFLNEVRTIRRYTSEANHNSFIMKDMIPVYRSAANQYGTGKSSRQISIVQGHIEGETLFPQLSIDVSTSMNALIAKTITELKSLLLKVLLDVKEDFNIVLRAQAEGRTSQANLDKDKEKRVQAFAKEVKDLKQRHGVLVQSIELL